MRREVSEVPARGGRTPLVVSEARAETEGMFARYFVELPIESSLVERALLDAPGSWVPGLAHEANKRGDTLLADVGFCGDARIARQVAIEFGHPVRIASKTVLPLRWSATGATGLFPSLDADLEIAPLGPDR